jgi:hypothetical protein
MCFEHHIIHGGCGHVGLSHETPFGLCPDARHRLLAFRGISPASKVPSLDINVPKRTSLSFTKRIFSVASSASSQSPTKALRRSFTAPTAPSIQAPDLTPIADYEFSAVKCAKLTPRTIVQPRGPKKKTDVCATCKDGIEMMRFLVQRYGATGCVIGCRGFAVFLKEKETEEDKQDRTGEGS